MTKPTASLAASRIDRLAIRCRSAEVPASTPTIPPVRGPRRSSHRDGLVAHTPRTQRAGSCDRPPENEHLRDAPLTVAAANTKTHRIPEQTRQQVSTSRSTRNPLVARSTTWPAAFCAAPIGRRRLSCGPRVGGRASLAAMCSSERKSRTAAPSAIKRGLDRHPVPLYA
jgi:hypothetical protein